MRSSRYALSAFLAASAASYSFGALAESAAPVRVRGAIESITPTGMVVKTRSGADAPIQLPENISVVAVTRAKLADIKAGTYVGVAGLPNPDGSQKALEVLIFPEAMRGAGEGHRPWDLLPGSTMTNATVAETVTKADGPNLTLTYKDGQKIIVVPPEAPVVTLAPAARADIQPGLRVLATVTKGADGSEIASNVIVGRDGVDPPM